MGRILSNRVVLAGKAEVTEGTAIALAGADANNLIMEPKFDADVPMFKRKFLNNSLSPQGQIATTRGSAIAFKCEVKGSGAAGTAPAFGKYLKSCGFKEVVVAATSVTYSPESSLAVIPTMTIATYRDGLKKQTKGARGNVKYSAKSGEPGMLEFEFIGVDVDVTDVALPTPSGIETTIPFPLLSAVFSIASFQAFVSQLQFDMGNVLERRGEGARLVQVALFRSDGAVHRLEIGTGSPLREASRVRRLFEDRLTALGDACDPGFGYDVVRLGALATERCDPTQTGLAGPDHAAELAHLIDRLGARFGLRRVTRLVPQDTHIPEYAVAAVAAATTSSFFPSPLWGGSRTKCAGWGSSETHPQRHTHYPPPQPSPNERAFTPVFDGLWGEGARDRASLTQESFEQDSLAPTRPIRLFERPEPIEAIAAVPDGPPVQFTWRRVRYVVAHAEGPERIAMEWWRDEQGQALTRDYFRVESHEGVRVWLYRQGLFDKRFFNERSPPTWFLQVVSVRVQRRFRDRVTIALESHVARLQASVATIAHQERPEYLDRLAVLRDQVFVPAGQNPWAYFRILARGSAGRPQDVTGLGAASGLGAGRGGVDTGRSIGEARPAVTGGRDGGRTGTGRGLGSARTAAGAFAGAGFAGVGAGFGAAFSAFSAIGLAAGFVGAFATALGGGAGLGAAAVLGAAPTFGVGVVFGATATFGAGAGLGAVAVFGAAVTFGSVFSAVLATGAD